MNLIVLIDKLLINLCIEYKRVLLLQSTEKKITIFLSVGILEQSPLIVPYLILYILTFISVMRYLSVSVSLSLSLSLSLFLSLCLSLSLSVAEVGYMYSLTNLCTWHRQARQQRNISRARKNLCLKNSF